MCRMPAIRRQKCTKTVETSSEKCVAAGLGIGKVSETDFFILGCGVYYSIDLGQGLALNHIGGLGLGDSPQSLHGDARA
jgi:hypothetical protein